MKRMLTKVLSVMLLVALLMIPVAFMEELQDGQTEYESDSVNKDIPNTDESVVFWKDVAVNADPIKPEDGIIPEAGNVKDFDPEEVVTTEPVDEIVEEQPADLDDILEVQYEEVCFDLDEKDEFSKNMAAGYSLPLDTTQYFPNTSFRVFLDENYNTNNDKYLSQSEIEAVTSIEIPHRVNPNNGREESRWADIDSLQGIEYFTNLTYLDCCGCELTSLNISKNTKLETLDCSYNHLTTIDVQYNNKLQILICNDNNITEIKGLNLSENKALTSLQCWNNKISSLNLSKNKALEVLRCNGNILTALDVSANTALNLLDCANNKLKTLRVGTNTVLDSIYCEGNSISELDISGVPKIVSIVNTQHKWSTSPFVRYGEEADKDDSGNINVYGIVLFCDINTKLITTKGTSDSQAVAPTTATQTSSTTSETYGPLIPAIKRSGRVTITAAPGTYCGLDLGGSIGRKFKSSRKKVATVDSTGLVTIKGAGKTNITFKVGKKKRTVKLTVKDPTVPNKISLNMSGVVTVKKGDTVKLTATIPSGTNSGIKWKTNKRKIAVVNNGEVTFKRTGKVTITATCTRGGKKAVVKFKVDN